MCGINGFIDGTNKLNELVLEKFNEAIRHRGPDSEGIFIAKTNKATIGLGHVRLSILDLSALGNQPMHFEHLHIVLNGEIYNFQEIKADLRKLGYSFASESDTEMVIKAFHAWGMDCVNRFIGMFAFAIFDESNHQLFLCRDRAGVKPLYYYKTKNQFVLVLN